MLFEIISEGFYRKYTNYINQFFFGIIKINMMKKFFTFLVNILNNTSLIFFGNYKDIG